MGTLMKVLNILYIGELTYNYVVMSDFCNADTTTRSDSELDQSPSMENT